MTITEMRFQWLSPKHKNSLIDWKPVSKHLLCITQLQIHQTLRPDLRTWKGKRPTEISKSPQAAMKKIPSHEAVIVQEYLNARVEVKNKGRQRTLGKECIGSRQGPQAVWLLWRKLPWNARNNFFNWRSIQWHWSYLMANKDSSRPYYH